MKESGNPGNANLPIGDLGKDKAGENTASQETGDPRKPGNANLPIGDLGKDKAEENTASQETGDPRKPGKANLPIGDWIEEKADQEIGVPSMKKTAIQENGVPGVEKTAGQETGVPKGKKTAIQENGVPGVDEWRSRGYMPHYDNTVATQHVTFHLADSLPVEVLQRLEIELKAIPEEKQDVERRKRLDAWIDAGHGSCILREPAIARMVENSILFFDAQRYRLLAWVVMPNHVHVLFQPMNGWTVAGTVASWKKFTARRICDYRKLSPGNANLPIGDLIEEVAVESGVYRRTVGAKES